MTSWTISFLARRSPGLRPKTRFAASTLGALLFAASLPAMAQDASELIVRLNRLEGQMRQLSGQVEQLGHENRQLKERLQKFGEDVEYRFQEQQKSGRPASPPAKSERPAKRGDAYDPESAPQAPGAPKSLGASQAGRDGIAGIIERDGQGGSPRPAPGADARGVAGLNPDAGRAAGGGAGAGGAKAAYDSAYAAYGQKQYAQAEAGFRDFVREHPRDKLAGDATYWLGESLSRQNKSKEAAQQYLKVTQEHGKSTRAPEAMLKLGMSLSSLGAKEQACATLAELGRKYPSAAQHVKQGAEREQKKAGCAA